MDTETFILSNQLDFDISKHKFPKINTSNTQILSEFIEFTRYVQEIYQLFHLFRFNQKNMLNLFTFYKNDKIIRTEINSITEDDKIIINGLIINYFSSAKTLIDAMESFMKVIFGDTSKEYIDFKNKVLSYCYDNNFSYRFFYNLRNYSQHGHLPLDYTLDNRYYFNIYSLLNTPHFETKKNIKEEYERIINDIYLKYQDSSRIIVTHYLANFSVCIERIYNKFLKGLVRRITSLKKSVEKIIKNTDNIFCLENSKINSFVIFKDLNQKIHSFNPKNDSLKMILDFINESNIILKEEEQFFSNLK